MSSAESPDEITYTAFDQTADQLLNAPFSSVNPQLHWQSEISKYAVRDRAITLLLSDWGQSADYAVSGLRLAMVFSCLPSLEVINASRAHDHTVAGAVTKNIHDLVSIIFPDKVYEGLDEHPQPHKIVGNLSEMAILGTLWWGIANGYRDSKSYVLPVTWGEDYGIRKDGLSMGTDLILRSGGKSKKRQRIQVKSSADAVEAGRPKYHPEVAIIAPPQLTGGRRNGPFELLEAIKNNDGDFLAAANIKASKLLELARENGIAHHRIYSSRVG